MDLDQIMRQAEAGQCPRHAMAQLGQRLEATFHSPEATTPITWLDRLRAKIIGRPEHWALARQLAAQVNQDDLVYCIGEEVGIPVAALCGAKPNRPKIVTAVHNLSRPRGKVALRLFGGVDRIDLFVPFCTAQQDFLLQYLNLPKHRVYLLSDQTDMKFFCPGTPSPDKLRPVIASVGLERRDYRLLAEVTAEMDVDVKISGFSKDVAALAKTFPDVMPANMSRRFYEWAELVQLYRDADLVVLPLKDSVETSGITTLMEAMACRRPLIVTKTQGLADYLAIPGAVTAVEEGDAPGLKQAITYFLDHPEAAEQQAQRGYEAIVNYYNSDRFVAELADRLLLVAEAA